MSTRADAPSIPGLEGGPAPGSRRLSRIVRRRTGLRSSLPLGLAIIGAAALMAILAPVLAPYDPLDQEISNALAPPGSDGHLLGTDALGRDVLSRLLFAARTDLFVAIAALVCPFVIGLVVGTVAGYRGGAIDAVVVGIVNVVFAFPVLVLLIALVFVLGPGIATIIIAITLVGWVSYATLARGSVRRERSLEYVLAARVGGVPTSRILTRHILPNVIAQPVVYAFSDAVLILIFITTLGFLGLGVTPPAPDWGTMIAEAQPYFVTDWWLGAIPGLVICITGLGFALIADGLAQKLDAR
jgi:peptide/nickel transport system permease protein